MPHGPATARGQHYVPRMLQSAFARPGKGRYAQVHVFDKRDDRTFRTAPENMLQARDFNTYDDGTYVVCIEGGLGKIEAQTAPVFAKIRQDRSLAELTLEERVKVMAFTALQGIRGVSVRTNMLDVAEQMRERIRSQGHDPDLVPQLKGSNDPEQVKLTAMMFASESLPEFTVSFADKVMLLIEAAPGTTFLLGDAPAVMANQHDLGLRGNLGLKVKGIQVYLPIAPDLAIGFWCPSLALELERGLQQTEESLRRTAGMALLGIGPEADQLRRMRADLTERVARLRADVEAIRAQRPLQSCSENMDYYNSLQVTFSERYVLSATGDFSLVRRMIADDPERRRGARMELA